MAERIRSFRPADLEACYAISLATGFEGGDAAHLYPDPKMTGHLYVAPYALLEPALALVAEDGDGVAGVAVGTADTVAWEQRLARPHALDGARGRMTAPGFSASIRIN